MYETGSAVSFERERGCGRRKRCLGGLGIIRCGKHWRTRFTTSNHICPGGSPDKSGCIKAAKLSGVLSEFELAVDISKSVCFLSRCFLILFGDVWILQLESAADSEGADYQTFKALLKWKKFRMYTFWSTSTNNCILFKYTARVFTLWSYLCWSCRLIKLIKIHSSTAHWRIKAKETAFVSFRLCV